MSVPALSPQAHGKYWGDFSTVGLSFPGGCRKTYSWYDCFGHEEKLDQEAYVEQNKAKVHLNEKSYGVRNNLPQDKSHLLSSGEN